MKIVFIVLSFVLVAGCNPAQQENESARAESVSSQPEHFKKNSGEPENFNRDVHVLRTLWTEVSALDPSKEEQAERYNLLLEALREKIKGIEPILPDLSESDQSLIREIKSFLKEAEKASIMNS